jgi:imidazolonepropionase-like amidohydrolase
MRSLLLALACLTAAVPASAQSVALVDVNVAPMDSERVFEHQTVLVTGSRISAIGPVGATPVPAGARVVEGHGAYLTPGLADMHVHLVADSNELALYVANGVTTVRELSGEPRYLAWRREIAAGARTGPNLIISSPLIDAPSGRRATAWRYGMGVGIPTLLVLAMWPVLRRVRTVEVRRTALLSAALVAMGAGYAALRFLPFPDALMPDNAIPHWWVGNPREAAASVERARGTYDLVKLYERLTPDEFTAATRAARRAGIHSVAHVPFAMGLARTLGAGVDELAHLYFLVVELQARTDGAASDSALSERMREIVLEVQRSGVAVTTTIVPLPELLEQMTDSTAFLARDDMKYRTPAVRRAVRERLRAVHASAAVRDLLMHVRWGKIAALGLYRAGVPLVLGTDDAPMNAVAGLGAHEELEALVASGLSPYEALRTATVNARRVAPGPDSWGILAVGARADLVLSPGNPLADVRVLRRPAGVMVAGRWYDRLALDSLLEGVVRRRAGSEPHPN